LHRVHESVDSSGLLQDIEPSEICDDVLDDFPLDNMSRRPTEAQRSKAPDCGAAVETL